MSEQEHLQYLYKRLARLDDQIVLQRMKALGYWPIADGLPPDPPDEAAERKQIEAELARIGRSALTVDDVQAALKAERARRWEESKKRRALRKAQADADRRARRDAWQAHKLATIVHAGSGVSDQLNDAQSDAQKLTRAGLPVLHSASDLAAALGISIGKLRWLTYHRRGATLVHYHRYEVPKKTGGVRAISAPKPALDACQRWILAMLAPLGTSAQAHGFVAGRSTLSNAQNHVGRALLVNLDLKDFFPSVRFTRVRGLFRAFGYSGAVATLLALLTTEPPRIAGAIAGDPLKRRFHIAIGERQLPQGACTSPLLTNLICKRLDARLAGLARRAGFVYTRYADDLSFSGPDRSLLGPLLGAVRRILHAEGFTEHPDKTHVMGQAQRQEVTGLVVNTAVGLKRDDKRRLRAMLHNAARTGLDAQNRAGHPNFQSYLRGWVAYASMVEPERAQEWYAALARAVGGNQ